MPVPLDPRTKLERQRQALVDRRRVIDRLIWALEEEIAALPESEPHPRRRRGDGIEHGELATA